MYTFSITELSQSEGNTDFGQLDNLSTVFDGNKG